MGAGWPHLYPTSGGYLVGQCCGGWVLACQTRPLVLTAARCETHLLDTIGLGEAHHGQGLFW
jgi:hypothetical protein